MFTNMWYQTGRLLAKGYARLAFNPDIEMCAPIPDGAKILAANHPSTVDPVMMTTLTREPVGILISETLFKVPLLGTSLSWGGHITVQHGNGKACLEEASRRLQAGQTVGIFPEGAISPLKGGSPLAGGSHRAHTGVARLALANDAPVVPVGIYIDRQRVWLTKTMVDGREETGTWYLSGPYWMTVGEPMRFEGDLEDRARVREVADLIMQRINQLACESEHRATRSGISATNAWRAA